MTDMLEESFRLQRELQERTYGKDPGQITDPEERIQFIKDMTIALEDELHEFLGETGWKPWATSRHVNEEEAKGELVDAYHFFMNLCMAVKMDSAELFERYQEKRTRNQNRQAAGYDGVDGKCIGCKRAFDDLSKAWGMPIEQVHSNRGAKGYCLECEAALTGDPHGSET